MLSQLTTLLGLGPASREMETQKAEEVPFDFSSIYSETDPVAIEIENKVADGESVLVESDSQEIDSDALIDDDKIEFDGEDYVPKSDGHPDGDDPENSSRQEHLIGSRKASDHLDRVTFEKTDTSGIVQDRPDPLAGRQKEGEALLKTEKVDFAAGRKQGFSEVGDVDRNKSIDVFAEKSTIQRPDETANQPKKTVSRVGEAYATPVTDHQRNVVGLLPRNQGVQKIETAGTKRSSDPPTPVGDGEAKHSPRDSKVSEDSSVPFREEPKHDFNHYRRLGDGWDQTQTFKMATPIFDETGPSSQRGDGIPASFDSNTKELPSKTDGANKDKLPDLPIFGLQQRLLKSRPTYSFFGKPGGQEVAVHPDHSKHGLRQVDSITVTPERYAAPHQISAAESDQPLNAEIRTTKTALDGTPAIVGQPAEQRVSSGQSPFRDEGRSVFQGIAKSDTARIVNAEVTKASSHPPISFQTRLDGGGGKSQHPVDPIDFGVAEPKQVERVSSRFESFGEAGADPLHKALVKGQQTQIGSIAPADGRRSERKLANQVRNDETKAINASVGEKIVPKTETAEAKVERAQEFRVPFGDIRGSFRHHVPRAEHFSSDPGNSARAPEMMAAVKPALISQSDLADLKGGKGHADISVKVAEEQALRKGDARDSPRNGWVGDATTNTEVKASPILKAAVGGKAPELTQGDRNLGVTSPFLADGLDRSGEKFALELSASGAQTDVRSTPGTVAQPLTAARAEPYPVLRQIADAAARMTDGAIEIRLSPEELGGVRMQLVQGETSMTVHITAERQETLDLMKRHIDQLARDLAAAGYDGAEFSFGGDGGGRDRGRDGAPRDTAIQQEPETPQSPTPSPVSDGLDLRF